MTQHPITVFQIAVQLHEADGDETVKPSVCQRLHRLVEPISFDTLEQLLSLSDNRCGKGAASDDCHIALLRDRLNLRCRNPVERSAIRYRLNKISTCLWSVALECGVVHRGLSQRISIRSPL